jgi:hypothetical protein
MANSDDILGASYTIDSSEVKKGAAEMMQSLEQIKSGIESSGSAIEKISQRIAKGSITSKQAYEELGKELSRVTQNVQSMLTQNTNAIDTLTRKRNALQQQRVGNYNSNELNNIEKALQKLDAELAKRRAINNVLKEQSAQVAQCTDATNKIDTSKLQNSTQSLRAEIKGIAAALAEMEAAGLRGTDAYNALRERGARLTDMMSDAKTQMKLLAHDNAGLQGVISGVQGVTGAFTAATGAVTLFGGESENLQRAMVKVQAVMSISMGIQQTLNALNKDSALRLGVISKLEQWWAQCKEQAAAATSAQVASEKLANTEKEKEVIVNASAAASQTTMNAATEAGTVANTAHAFSWRAVGIAIKSVPVFGWIITALSALVAVIAAFYSHTKNAVTQTKLLGDAMKSVAGDVAKEQSALNVLYKKATDVNQSMKERMSAVKALKTEYPDYFKNLKDETILVGGAAAAYRQLTRDIRESALTKGLQETLADTSKTIAEWYGDNASDAQWLAKNRNRAKQLKQAGVQAKAPVMSNSTAMAAAQNYGNAYAIANSQDTSRTADERFLYEYNRRYAAYQLRFKRDNKKALERVDMLTGMISARSLVKDVHEDTTTDTTSTSANTAKAATVKAATSVRDTAEAEALKTQRAIEDAINAEAQIAIDKRAEGLDKELAQIQLNHDKKIDAIERAFEDEQLRLQKADADANGGKKRDVSEFAEQARTNTGYDTAIAQADEELAQKQQAAYQKQLDVLSSFISKYGSLQQQRAAMEQGYAKRIEAAQAGGNFADVLNLQAERAEKRKSFDKQSLESNVDWQSVFGDVSVLTQSQLESAKAYLKSKLTDKSLTVDQYKVAAEQIDKINEQLAKNSDKIAEAFGLVNPYLQKQAQLQQEAADAAEADAIAQERKLQAQAALIAAQKQLNALLQQNGIQTDSSNISEVVQQVQKSSTLTATQKANITKQVSAVVQATTDAQSASDIADKTSQNKSATQSKVKVFSEDTSAKMQGTLSMMNLINANVQELPGLLDKLGVDMDSGFGRAVQGVADTMGNVTTAFQDLAQGNFIGAASSMVSAVYSLGDTIFGGANHEYQDLMEKYSSVIDVWNTLISKKKEYITESWGTEAVAAADEALQLLQTEREVQQSIIEAKASEGKSWRSHSIGYKMWRGSDDYDFNGQTWQNQATAIAALTGAQFNSIYDFANMTSEQLEKVRENYSGLWGRMDSDFREALEKLIDYGDEYSDLLDTLNEQLTGFSFDSLRDSFVSSLMDMDTDVDDFLDDVSKKFMQAQLTTSINTLLGDELQAWYDDFADSMADGKLTSADVSRLRATYESLAQEAVDIRDSVAEITGYDITSSQSSTSKGFEAMSATTADELNGRFTALQIAGEAIRSQVEAQTVTLTAINADTQSMRYNVAQIVEGVKASVEIQTTSAEHLAKIEGYTSNLPAMLTALNKINDNTKNI